MHRLCAKCGSLVVVGEEYPADEEVFCTEHINGVNLIIVPRRSHWDDYIPEPDPYSGYDNPPTASERGH